MLLDLVSGMFSGQTISFWQLLTGLFSALFVIFATMPVHEWAHAFVAYKLGDPTAKYNGRLTLNPMAHIHWIGAVLVLLFGFGFAKPVPVNAANFRRPKWGMALVAFAGPLANFLMAFFCLLFGSTAYLLAVNYDSMPLVYVAYFFQQAGIINIYLAAFNLIPLPPLDGSRILFAVLPDRIYYRVQAYERYIYLIVIFCAAFGLLRTPTNWIAGRMIDLCSLIINSIFKLIL